MTIAQQGTQVASSVLLFALIALVAVGIFLLIRSIMLWYWKIDTIVANQHKQLEELKRLVDLTAQGTRKKETENIQ